MRTLIAKLGGWLWNKLGLEPIGANNEPPYTAVGMPGNRDIVQSSGGCCAEGATCGCGSLRAGEYTATSTGPLTAKQYAELNGLDNVC